MNSTGRSPPPLRNIPATATARYDPRVSTAVLLPFTGQCNPPVSPGKGRGTSCGKDGTEGLGIHRGTQVTGGRHAIRPMRKQRAAQGRENHRGRHTERGNDEGTPKRPL
ncbi:hypothetical protein GZL_03159 [Streptomyces sp. 769]|nr:hypothetical protein GZL_03159 [Streptomyces sp. 769]